MQFKNIMLAHGSGGRLTAELIKNVFSKHFSNKILEELEDSAIIENPSSKLAFTTDSYVVDPLFFPGGDIGKIAVCGTVNDLSVKGAKPFALSCSFIIEEGFEMKILEKIVISMKNAAKEAKVFIVTGDTKVVEKGKADKIFINTSGVGFLDNSKNFSQKNIRQGDFIIVSGFLAAHGIAVMNERNNLGIKGNIKSDTAPLNGLISKIKNIKGVKCFRDATRGGVAMILNEAAHSSGFSIEIDEELVPVSDSVRSACSILGIDPLYVANEGLLICFVAKESAKKVLNLMRKHKYGVNAKIIGQVLTSKDKKVLLKTAIGARRFLTMPEGEQLPRIC